MALTNEIRRTLADRVQRKVAGRGISRRDVEDAVDRVSRALGPALDGAAAAASASAPATAPAHACGCASHGGAGAPAPDGILAVTAASTPDLASKLREVLTRQGATVPALGSATSGRYTVVTLRADAALEAAVRRAAESLGARVAAAEDAR